MPSTCRSCALLAAVALAGLVPLHSPAAGTAQASTFSIERLLGQLGAVEAAQARFVEERRLAILEEPLVTEGTLSYQAPDHLIRQDLLPKPALYEIEAGTITVINDDGEFLLALGDQPLLRASITPLLAALAGDQGALERDFELDLAGGESGWTLTLAPRSDPFLDVLREIVLAGSAGQIDQITMHEQDGDVISMRLTYAAP
jgi:hypothetical protein